MSDQELRDLVGSLAIDNKEIKEQMKEIQFAQKETDKQMKETDRKLQSIGIQLGNMSQNQGDIAEEYFINSLKKDFNIIGVQFDQLLSNVELKTKKINDEFDIVLVNGNTLAVIEVKYKVHPNDLEKLERKTKNIKLISHWADYKVYGGIACFKIPQDVIDEAKKSGYFILQQKGDIVVSIAENLKVV